MAWGCAHVTPLYLAVLYGESGSATWLIENGYMTLKSGSTTELPENDPKHTDVFLSMAVDWSKTRAYGMGFNGLYLNIAGREGQGIVPPEQADAVAAFFNRTTDEDTPLGDVCIHSDMSSGTVLDGSKASRSQRSFYEHYADVWDDVSGTCNDV